MIRVDGTEVKAFADQLRGLDKETQKELRPAIRKAGQVLLQDIRSNASWSSRIPKATKLFIGFGPRSSGVQIRTSRRQAPHARPFEGITGRGDTFRHPVFGNTDKWVDQPTRPFIQPAVRANEDRVVGAIQKAIDQTLGRLG